MLWVREDTDVVSVIVWVWQIVDVIKRRKISLLATLDSFLLIAPYTRDSYKQLKSASSEYWLMGRQTYAKCPRRGTV